MKRWICFTLLLSLGLFTSSLPLSLSLPPPSDHEITPHDGPRFEKRTDHIEPDIPRPPKTPTHADHPKFPQPGKSGAYYDKKNNLVWLMYGDNMVNHAKHLKYIQSKNPETLMPMELADEAEKKSNRHDALKGIPTQPGMVRDEKPLAMLSYSRLGTTPTVYMVPRPESNSEGGHTSTFKRLLAKNPGSKGVLRTNLLHGDLEPDMGKVVRPSNKAGGAPGRNINPKRGSQTQSWWSRLKAHFPHRYNTRSSVKPIPVTTLSGMNLRPRKKPIPHAKELPLEESPRRKRQRN